MRILTAIVMAAILASVSACVTTSDGGNESGKSEEKYSRYEPYLGEPVDRINALRQDSWQPVSRTQLVLWTSINDAYMLTVDNTCPELKFAQSVGVTSTTSSISTLDSVIVRDTRCRIRQIQPIDVERMKADRRAE